MLKVIHLLCSLLAAATAVSATTASSSIPVYAPIPSTGTGPAVSPAIGYRTQAFGHGAYMVTDDLYQALFLVSTHGVIVVAAPPTIGRRLLYAIGNTTHLPITHVVYSHAHADHIGAATLYGSNATIIAHDQTLAELQAAGPTPDRPLPHTTFGTAYTLCVGNQTLELAYHGPNHEPGNIFIYAPVQKILMLVDLVFPGWVPFAFLGWVPFAFLGEAQSVPGFIKAHDQILAYDFAHYIGGHLERSGTRADVLIQKQYVEDLRDNCASALRLSAASPNASNPLSASVLLSAVAAADPGNAWASFKTYLGLLAGYCADRTNEKWQGKLAGADVYGFENAYQMIESLRIDYGVLGPFGAS